MNDFDDYLYFVNNDNAIQSSELSLKNKFNLYLIGEVKWYLGMRVLRREDFIFLDQDQNGQNLQIIIKK